MRNKKKTFERIQKYIHTQMGGEYISLLNLGKQKISSRVKTKHTFVIYFFVHVKRYRSILQKAQFLLNTPFYQFFLIPT